MKKIILICILIAPLVTAQEVKTYSKIEFIQEEIVTDVDSNWWVQKSEPPPKFSFLSQNIPLVSAKRIEDGSYYLNDSQIFKDKIGYDSIVVEVKYKMFKPEEHEINFVKNLIDNQKVFGHHVLEANSLYNTFPKVHYLESILIKKNNETLIHLPQVRPFIFSIFSFSVSKILGKDLFYLSFVGDEDIRNYFGFFLLDKKGQPWHYMRKRGTEDMYSPIDKDFFSAKNMYQYQMVYEFSFDAKTIAMWRLESDKPSYREGWTKYWNDYSKENLKLCKSLDLTPVIKSDSVFGEWGTFEKKPLLIYVYDVTRDLNDSLVYYIKGYNKLGTNTHSFEGRLQAKYVVHSELTKQDSSVKQILAITGDFSIKENKKQKESGEFTGSFQLTIGDLNPLRFQKSMLRTVYTGSFQMYNKKTIKLCDWRSLKNGNPENEGYKAEDKQWWKKIKLQ